MQVLYPCINLDSYKKPPPLDSQRYLSLPSLRSQPASLASFATPGSLYPTLSLMRRRRRRGELAGRLGRGPCLVSINRFERKKAVQLALHAFGQAIPPARPATCCSRAQLAQRWIYSAV